MAGPEVDDRTLVEQAQAGDRAALLLEQLERTLELLEHARPDDDGLYFWRAALWHEDQRGEQLLQLAQALGLAMPVAPSPPLALRGPTRKPVITSSMISSAPNSSHSARRPGRKSGCGGMQFMLPATGSTMIQAISSGYCSNAARTEARSL